MQYFFTDFPFEGTFFYEREVHAVYCLFGFDREGGGVKGRRFEGLGLGPTNQ